MAATQKNNLHSSSSSFSMMAIGLIVFILVVSSRPLSAAARRLPEHQEGLPRSITRAVPRSEDRHLLGVGAPMSADEGKGNHNKHQVEQKEEVEGQVFRLHPKGIGAAAPANKFGTWIFNMLPKGRTPPSAPSRGTNNLNN